MAAGSLDQLTGMSAARFGIYVHFPYCLSKCPYCDFASIVSREIPQRQYAEAIIAEMDLRLAQFPRLAERTIDSIFFGGGTPSLWDGGCVALVLEQAQRRFRSDPAAEISLEANPGAADAARFEGFRRSGVNRLSIGVQSFQASTLRALGREHEGEAAIRAFESARTAGFRNVSMDLIYGVHGQSVEQVVADVRQATSMAPEHLSAYALTLERDSLAEDVPLARQLERGEISLPPEDTILEMAAAIREICEASGLCRYEISNYARAGFHSRHNALYWTGGEYLGLGAGAVGSVSAPSPVRYFNHRSPDRYLRDIAAKRMPESSREQLAAEHLFEERLAMGLRLSSGVDLDAVCLEFEQPAERRREEAQRLVDAGLARRDGKRLSLTERGSSLHTSICARLI